jgi:hypothetical protein
VCELWRSRPPLHYGRRLPTSLNMNSSNQVKTSCSWEFVEAVCLQYQRLAIQELGDCGEVKFVDHVLTDVIILKRADLVW